MRFSQLAYVLISPMICLSAASSWLRLRGLLLLPVIVLTVARSSSPLLSKPNTCRYRAAGWQAGRQADALCRQISARTKDKWSRRGGHDWRHTGHLPATCRVVRQKGTIENYYFNWRQRLHRQRVRPPPPPPAACRLAQVRQLELKANRLQIASHSLLSQSLLVSLTLPRLVTQLHLTNCSICCLDLP